jgi:RNA polymerase sigma-70 factor (ECF subfamily)
MKDDARAVASALAGNREGFRALFERHRLAVERVVAGFAELEDAEARDLVVESFGRAFGQLGGLREPARFGAWLLGVTRRRCRSRLARKRSAEAISADLATAAVLDLAPDPGPAPVDVGALIEAIPPGPESEAARLFHGEGRRTARRVGEKLGMAPEVVSRHLEHLRSRVKARVVAALLAQRALGEEGPPPAHLDATVWNHVLRGERFRGEAALAQHLKSDCAACEAFLMGLQGTDGLDGDVERALVGDLAPAPLRSDAIFEQAMRSLALHLRVTGAAPPGAGGARPQPGKGRPLAMAAVLAVLGLGVLALQHGPRQSPHQTNAKPAIGLEFSVAERGKVGSGEKGTPGARYGQDHVVYLRYEPASAAFITLLRIRPDGTVEVLSEAGRVGPGPHVLTVNGSPAGVSLQSFPGRNRFVAVASPAPVAPEALVALFTAFPEEAAAAPVLEGSAVARFDVEVAP